MKVLVTGGTGFLGSHTVRSLAEAGHDVRMLVRSPERVGAALDPLGVQVHDIVVGDVTDERVVQRAVNGCDAAVHTAGVFSFGAHLAQTMEQVNTSGTEIVLRKATAEGLAPIVHVSSVMALLGHTAEITDQSPVGQAVGPYSASKVEAERIARRYQQDGSPVVITNPGAVWGPNDPHMGESSQSAVMIAKGMMRAVPDGPIPLVDVRDVGEAHARIIGREAKSQRYPLVGENITVTRLIELAGQVTGRNLRATTIPHDVAIALGRAGDLLSRAIRRQVPLSAEPPAALKLARPMRADRAMQDLAMSFRSAEESVRDTFAWLLAEGAITPKQAGTLADSTAARPRRT